MTVVILALVITSLGSGWTKALPEYWRSVIGCDAIWTIWSAFLAGSYGGALPVALCLLLDMGPCRKALRPETHSPKHHAITSPQQSGNTQ